MPTDVYQALQTLAAVCSSVQRCAAVCSGWQRFAAVCSAASLGGSNPPGEGAQQTAANGCKRVAAL
eukprot:12697770-Alexandrium_andersonii.AAC.1